MLTSSLIADMLLQTEKTRKKIEAPIVEWLKEQGIDDFDSKLHNIILPMHMKELFTLDIPEWLVFAEYIPVNSMYRVDKSCRDIEYLFEEKI